MKCKGKRDSCFCFAHVDETAWIALLAYCGDYHYCDVEHSISSKATDVCISTQDFKERNARLVSSRARGVAAAEQTVVCIALYELTANWCRSQYPRGPSEQVMRPDLTVINGEKAWSDIAVRSGLSIAGSLGSRAPWRPRKSFPTCLAQIIKVYHHYCTC